jgi:phosphotransferase system enzyme I (PtsP)
VYVRPNETIVHSFRNRIQAPATLRDRAAQVKPETYTRDGVRIRLMANINLLSDVSLAQSLKCDGVGLYRTEFPFIVRSDFPTEEEQFVAYRRLVESMGSKPVTFRTLDIGGDKVLSYYPFPQEQNPSMGMRSIRFSLDNRPIFLQQLRAILRAGVGADLRVMFPMIASLDDFCQARQLLRQAADQLKAEQIPHNDSPKVGMMVELPAVIPMIESLAAEADFFSIGTNDLIQFMLGVDRTNEKVESYYLPHHPALFRSIRDVVVAAERHGREVSICGDMAHEMAYLTVLVGMGVRTLSVEPLFIPQIQQILSTVDSGRAKTLSDKVLSSGSVGEIERLLGIERGK